jgi:magnesium-transporting ATPase (P-type)
MRIPADCVIVSVEDRCYINTSQLDGERNLKSRFAAQTC